MDVADLKTFEAVARLGGMSRAAESLNTVQSNVTNRIRNLESALGETLFHRHSRGVTLTAAGERLLPYAQKAQALMEEARRAVADGGTPSGTLTIGSLETTAAIRLSPLLNRYATTWPDVDLVLRTGTTEEMVEAVLTRQVEGAFVCGPVEHKNLVVEPALREELVAVTARHVSSLEAALDRPAVKLAVLRAGCSYRQRLEDLLARRGVTGRRLMEFGTLDSVVAAASAGIGITLLPRAIAHSDAVRHRVQLHPLPPNDAWVDTVFVRRRDGYVSTALNAFREMVAGAEKLQDAA